MGLDLLLAVNQGWASPVLDVFFGWISQKKTFSLPLLVLILWLLWRREGRAGLRLWLLLIVCVLLGDAIGNGLKHLFGQLRPCAELSERVRLVMEPFRVGCAFKPTGMPSNHALNFFLTAAFLGMVLRSWRWGLVLGGIAVLVALSRVYLGVHYSGQVLAGAGFGLLLGALAARAVGAAPALRRWMWGGEKP
ncbi:MAG: phosphatase PAP2 family protein [Gammaproteobacteria bacterium]|nr:phosphatase PAP2 family protein [Gammaproteobacteria bacterium]